jgi:hypothetical protein
VNLTFASWLFNQIERKDQIGKLARAMEQIEYGNVKPRGKPDQHKKWANIVTRYGEPEHVLAFNQAWREYLAASQA